MPLLPPSSSSLDPTDIDTRHGLDNRRLLRGRANSYDGEVFDLEDRDG